jgi:hypothetical protein
VLSPSPPATYSPSDPNTPSAPSTPTPSVHEPPLHYDRPSFTPTQNSRQIAKLQPHLFHTLALDTRTAGNSALRPLCHWGRTQIVLKDTILVTEKIGKSVLLERIEPKIRGGLAGSLVNLMTGQHGSDC